VAKTAEVVRGALDEALADQIKGLANAAWGKVTGGESVDAAMKEFDAGLVLELAKLRCRLVEETEKILAGLGAGTGA
jgi:hypothetical protein